MRQRPWALDASYGVAVATSIAVGRSDAGTSCPPSWPVLTSAIASGSFGWHAALIGWVAGAVILTGLAPLPPRPAVRLCRAAPLRVVALGVSWVAEALPQRRNGAGARLRAGPARDRLPSGLNPLWWRSPHPPRSGVSRFGRRRRARDLRNARVLIIAGEAVRGSTCSLNCN